MDGQDSGQRKKPHGNQHPKRGSIMKTIITDWTGGSGGGDSKKSPGTATSPGGGAKDDTNNGGGS
jgi:hypothetical protein